MTDRPDFQVFPDDARILAREAEYEAYLAEETRRLLEELNTNAQAQR